MTNNKVTKKVRVINTRKKIENTIETHNSFKNSYFWSGNNKSNYLNWINNFNFKFNKKVYEIKQSCSSSSKNVYYNLQIYVNGEQKNIRSLKAII